MGATKHHSGDQSTAAERSDTKYYLPAMASHSSEPGRVERILTTIFRRRGEVALLVRP